MRAIGSRILVTRRDTSQEPTDDRRIITSATAKDAALEGVVVSVGRGRPDPVTGAPCPPDVSVGDVVLFSRYAATEVVIGSATHLVIAEEDVLLVLEDVARS